VLIAVSRLDGKMNASELALVAVPRQNSNSASIDAGSQTKESLPSVLVSTSMPSVMLLSIRRLFRCLSFHRSANILPGRRPSTRNMRTMSLSRSLRWNRIWGISSGVRCFVALRFRDLGTASLPAGFFGSISSSTASSSIELRYTRILDRTLFEYRGGSPCPADRTCAGIRWRLPSESLTWGGFVHIQISADRVPKRAGVDRLGNVAVTPRRPGILLLRCHRVCR